MRSASLPPESIQYMIRVMKLRVGYAIHGARQGQAPLRLLPPPRPGGGHARRHPRGGPAPVRGARLRGDLDGRDRGRGRRGAEDRLRGLRDQERPAACALEPPAPRRPRRRADRRAGVVPGARRRAGPRAPAPARLQPVPRGQAADRGRARGDPRRRAGRPGGHRAVGPHPDRVPRQPARDRREPRPPGTRSPRASTSTAPPTSSGRSTTPTCGSCWSASAAGRRSGGSAGRRTSPARS